MHRVHLVERVSRTPLPMVVLRAPAGYGKTTLMTQCAADAAQPVAWVSLDVSDNDPALLLSEIATAINRVVAIDPLVFRSLDSRAPAIRAEVVPRLLNDMARGPATLLVLDNLDVVHSGPGADALAMLCDHLPPDWKLLVAARQAPAVPLARLRANGMLLEVGPAELALTLNEARRLLEAAHMPLLETDAFETLYERMEGWAAGLYLAAVAASSTPNPSRTLGEVGGDERAIVEYVASEVLGRLRPDRLEFLVRTSVLDRFCPALCDAVLEREDSAAIIAELAQTAGFIVGLDQRQTWFRYHHLFAEVLRHVLMQTGAGRLPALHARASRWHECHGTPAEALEHALASSDRRRAAELFARNVRALLNGGGQATLRRWIQAFSDADLADYPPVAAGAAWVLGQLGERGPTRRYISILEHGDGSAGPFPFGERSTRSAVALLKAAFGWEGLSQMRAWAQAAYRLEPAGTEAHERGALFVGASLFLRGRLDAAQGFLEEAAAAGEADAPTAVFALGLLGLLHLEARRLAESGAAIREGLALMDGKQLHGYTASGALFAACAYLDLERDHPDAARGCLERAVSLLPTAAAVPWWSILLATWTGRVAIRLDEMQRAEWLLGQAQRELGRLPDCGMLAHWVQKQARALEAAHGGAGLLREPLTEAELRVLELVPTYLTLEEIGRSLCISRNTVKTHLKVIYGKLSVSSRSAAVARAQAVGLIGRHAARG